MQTNSLSAEYGRTGGAVVNIVHRSGTRDFHGTLYEFLRNEKLDANGFFRNRNGQTKSGYRYNQFGFTLGGPLTPSRERLFFFLNYEGLRLHNAGGGYYTVPTAKMHKGDFSDLLDPVLNNMIISPIYDPATIDTTGRRQPFSGNLIPANRQSPVAVKLLENYPLPTLSGTGNNYFDASGSQSTTNSFSSKIDYRVSSNHNLFGRIAWSDNDASNSDAFHTPGSPTIGSKGLRDRSLTVDDNLTKWGWIIHGNAGVAYKFPTRPICPTTRASQKFLVFPRI